MASTMTASGIREVSFVSWRQAGAAARGGGILRNEHEFSVRRVLLAPPRLADPVERKRLPLDLQLAAGGQLDEALIGSRGLLPRHVSKGESHDRQGLAA